MDSSESLMLQKPIYKSLMLTKVGQSEITIQGEGSCNMTILVVGGGGRAVRGYAANTGRGYGGGGGSSTAPSKSLLAQ